MSDSKKKYSYKKSANHQPIKRHRLTEEEKATVLMLYEELGNNCWEKVQQVLHLKSKRTAREHFYKFLITDSKRPFTPEEDELIIQKVKELGTKWSQISTFFEKRSDINIRNRYRILSRNLDPSKQKRKPRNTMPIVEVTKVPEITPKANIFLPSIPTNHLPEQSSVTVTSPEDPTQDYIILDFHHFDIITLRNMKFVTNTDYVSPLCFEARK